MRTMMEWDELQSELTAVHMLALTHASHGLAHSMQAGSYRHGSCARSMPSVILRNRYVRVDINCRQMSGLVCLGGSMLPFTCM